MGKVTHIILEIEGFFEKNIAIKSKPPDGIHANERLDSPSSKNALFKSK